MYISPERLSRRELEVMSALTGSSSLPEIAAEFGVSINTVKHHVRNIYSKLGVKSRQHAIRAFNQGTTVFT